MTAPGSVTLERLGGFVAALRTAGVEVAADALGTYAEAATIVGHEPGGLFWAGRATLVSRREDREVHDAVFRSYWLAPSRGRAEARGAPLTDPSHEPSDGAAASGAVGVDRSSAAPPVVPNEADAPDPGAPQPDALQPDAPQPDAVGWHASTREQLRHRTFASYDDHERRLARRLLGELRVTPDVRRGHRTRPARHGRGELDLRRTVAAARHTGGEVVRLHRRRRIDVPRRVVFLLDISGSMAASSRALLQFAQVAVASGTGVEVFTMGTRLTRLTRALRHHDPDTALHRAAAAVPDWAGGTRLGASIKAFNDRWGHRGMARGAIVVVLSDGWERDDPRVLARELGRLRLVAARVVWVNPLKATAGYQPVAGGMAAALPYVDDFVSGHDLDSLDDVIAALRRPASGRGRPAGASSGSSR